MIKARTIITAALGLQLIACGNEPDIEDQPLEPAAPGAETVPIEPPSAPPYVGVWAADSEICDISPGSADPAPIAFTETELIGYENRCRIGESVEGTEGGYRLRLFCEGEGVEYQETVDVDIDGVMLRLKRADADEAVFVRCEEEGEEPQ